MANSGGSGSAEMAEMYWDAFAEEEEQVGSCPGPEMEAAPPAPKSVVAAAASYGGASASGAGSSAQVAATRRVCSQNLPPL